MFLFRLADHLGRMVCELEQMPLEEVAEWQAYFYIKRQEE